MKGLRRSWRRLAKHDGKGIVGANVGANKTSEDRAADYVTGIEAVWPYCQYLTLNISSPNTPGLRGLQGQRCAGKPARALRQHRRASRRRQACLSESCAGPRPPSNRRHLQCRSRTCELADGPDHFQYDDCAAGYAEKPRPGRDRRPLRRAAAGTVDRNPSRFCG